MAHLRERPTGGGILTAKEDPCDRSGIIRIQLHGGTMVPVRDLFETHLTVADLKRSMTFFGEISDWSWRKCSGNGR